MTTVSDPVSASSLGGSLPSQPTAHPSSALGQDAFLKLLVTELQHQNPLDPMSERDFMGQLAQFSTLEQIAAVEKTLEQVLFATQVAQATALIGRLVTYERADGTAGEGRVDSVSFEQGGAIVLLVGGERVAPSAVRSVLE